MPATLRVEPNVVRTDPAIEGVEVSESEWRLDVDRYREFLELTTDISPVGDLSSSDCYRIGNRLQALVEERKRHDEWNQSLVDSYPDVKSLEEFLWLARFFRACHDAGEVCFAGRESGETSLSPQ